MHSRIGELVEEARSVLLDGRGVVDLVLPSFAFLVLLTALGFEVAAGGAVIIALAFVLLRLRQRRHRPAALGGVVGVVVAIGLAAISERQAGFFVPGMVTGGLTTILALVSVIVGRPLTAWTSAVVRRWPLAWYWHPLVRPAYTETTILWAAYFGGRLALQIALFGEDDLGGLATLNLVLGWPGIIALLVATYLYGIWRLGRLGGPSVDEFRRDAPPPWESQQRGF